MAVTRWQRSGQILSALLECAAGPTWGASRESPLPSGLGTHSHVSKAGTEPRVWHTGGAPCFHGTKALTWMSRGAGAPAPTSVLRAPPSSGLTLHVASPSRRGVSSNPGPPGTHQVIHLETRVGPDLRPHI